MNRLRCRTPWYDPEKGIVEHEITWTKNFIAQTERSLAYQKQRLAELETIKAWWERFINYCHTGK